MYVYAVDVQRIRCNIVLSVSLQMVENRVKQMKSAPPSVPVHSPGTATPTSSASSQVQSERSESKGSRESTASPQPIHTPTATKVSLPSAPFTTKAPVIIKAAEQLVDDERPVSPDSVQEQLSPAPHSYSYTPFSDSVTFGVAAVTVNGGSTHDQEDRMVHEEERGVVVDLIDQSEPAAVPEEHDTSHSTLVEEEGADEGEDIGDEDRQQWEQAVAASVEKLEDDTLVVEDKRLLEDLSAKSGSVSEHISDISQSDREEVEEEEEERIDVDQTVQPPEMESQEEQDVLPLIPPLEPDSTAAATTVSDTAKENLHDSEEKRIAAELKEEIAELRDSLDEKGEEEMDYEIGQRVLVGNVMSGTICYVGHTHFSEGIWVGVEIDLPRGRNDGSIEGRRYFSCEPNYGLFAPPQKITILEEDKFEEGEPPFEDEVSSVAEELEDEEQVTSEPEQGEAGEEEDRIVLDERASPLHSTPPYQDSPSPVDDAYSPDFESSPEEEEEEEEEREGEGIEERSEEVGSLHPSVMEEYQWPTSREQSPMTEYNQLEHKEEAPAAHLQDTEEYKEEIEEVESEVSEADKEMQKIVEDISSTGVKEKTMQITEHPPPASEMLETPSEKSESFPLAPEVANQRSQSATPTPAPPPEFAEGALKETPREPPPPPLQLMGEMTSTLKQSFEVISDELAQELTNEAYETMHNIWKAKREAHQLQLASQDGQMAKEDDIAALKETKKLSLEDKADLVTDQLLHLLLQSETNLACSIHNFKKSQEEENAQGEEQVLSPTTKVLNLQLPRSPLAKEPERLVLSPVPEEPPDDEHAESGRKRDELKEREEDEIATTPVVSPTRRTAPPKLTLTTGNIVESSPPPLSPPSPYRTSPFIPSFIPAADEFSPPGSPPKHLSQASAARVAAGEKSPFAASQDKERKGLERSTSAESITSLLDSLKIKTAQCMVPSERTSVNTIVERSWQVCEEVGFDRLHSHSPPCPNDILDMFSDLHELSPEESHCRRAYLELVFNLTVETLQSLHCTSEDNPVWTQESAVRALLAPEHKNGGEVTLEKIQKKVYKALMRGQLPSQLPAVKFLRGMKRPGGREIDFVDAILIKELREEEPGWIDYCGDEESVKMRTADSILDSLILETVQIMSEISRKHSSRQSIHS